jgi:DNA-binding MurR/RpiR family transcriptional regulator
MMDGLFLQSFLQSGDLTTSWHTMGKNNVHNLCYGPDRLQLLFVDSHNSHETLEIIQLAEAEQIEIFAFSPSHTTHILQPLDICLGSSIVQSGVLQIKSLDSNFRDRHRRFIRGDLMEVPHVG